MHYNFAAEGFHTKKHCNRLSSRKVQFFIRTLFIRLIGKLLVDFLLVIIELFFARFFILSQITRLTDRQTDGQMLIGRPRLHRCSAVEIDSDKRRVQTIHKLRKLAAKFPGFPMDYRMRQISSLLEIF